MSIRLFCALIIQSNRPNLARRLLKREDIVRAVRREVFLGCTWKVPGGRTEYVAIAPSAVTPQDALGWFAARGYNFVKNALACTRTSISGHALPPATELEQALGLRHWKTAPHLRFP